MEKFLSKVQTFPSAVATILVGIAAGPILGFILSSFAYVVLSKLYPEFIIPDETELERYKTALKILIPESQADLDQIFRSNAAGFFQRQKRSRKLLPYFNFLVHTRAPSLLIEYTARRWTIFWMSVNSICAFVVGSLFALSPPWDFLERNFAVGPFAIEIVLLSFVASGVWRIAKIRREIYQIAWLWLYNEARC